MADSNGCPDCGGTRYVRGFRCGSCDWMTSPSDVPVRRWRVRVCGTRVCEYHTAHCAPGLACCPSCPQGTP